MDITKISINHVLLLISYYFVAWLTDEMKVKVQFYDDKPLSASVPKRVTCTVKEGIAATPRYMVLSIIAFRKLYLILYPPICFFFSKLGLTSYKLHF